MTQNEQCAAHTAHFQRLDDRWSEHKKDHRDSDEALCDKFDTVFKRLDGLNSKLNWIMGGMAVMGPLLLVFIQLLISHISGTPK